MRDSKQSVKFMQVLDRTIFLRLKGLAKARGVTVQELIRVLVIPDWMRKLEEDSRKTDTRMLHRRLKRMTGRPTPTISEARSEQRKHRAIMS